jgi:hypothetical protein
MERMMEKSEQKLAEALNKDFPILTEENKKSIVDMAKFLVLAQNNIVPVYP